MNGSDHTGISSAYSFLPSTVYTIHGPEKVSQYYKSIQFTLKRSMIKSLYGIKTTSHAACSHAISRSHTHTYASVVVTRTPTIKFPFYSMRVYPFNFQYIPCPIQSALTMIIASAFWRLHRRALHLSYPLSLFLFLSCSLFSIASCLSTLTSSHTHTASHCFGTHTTPLPNNDTNRTLVAHTHTKCQWEEGEVRLFFGSSHYGFHSVELQALNASDVFNKLYRRARIIPTQFSTHTYILYKFFFCCFFFLCLNLFFFLSFFWFNKFFFVELVFCVCGTKNKNRIFKK